MKIPFLPLHIVKTQTLMDAILEKEQMHTELEAMRSLTSDFVPQIDQLITARHQAMIGRSAYGRRKARRIVKRKAQKLKMAMEEAA